MEAQDYVSKNAQLEKVHCALMTQKEVIKYLIFWFGQTVTHWFVTLSPALTGYTASGNPCRSFSVS